MINDVTTLGAFSEMMTIVGSLAGQLIGGQLIEVQLIGGKLIEAQLIGVN